MAISDKDTAAGLRLSGIHDIYIADENPVKYLDKIKERSDVGVVLITEKIASEISKDLKDFRMINSIPIILEIPDKNGRIRDHTDFVSHLVKKAVGININKEKDFGGT